MRLTSARNMLIVQLTQSCKVGIITWQQQIRLHRECTQLTANKFCLPLHDRPFCSIGYCLLQTNHQLHNRKILFKKLLFFLKACNSFTQLSIKPCAFVAVKYFICLYPILRTLRIATLEINVCENCF